MKRLLVILAFSVLSVSANAMMLELKAGYSAGSSSYKFASPPLSTAFPNGYSDAVTGAGYGALLAFNPLIFFFGPEVDYFGLTRKQDSTIGNGSYSLDVLQVYGVAGVDLYFLRLFGGYAPYSEATSNGQSYKGTAVKAGIGLNFFVFLKLNFEYITNTFDTVTVSGSESDISTTYSQFDNKTFWVNVSYVFGG